MKDTFKNQSISRRENSSAVQATVSFIASRRDLSFTGGLLSPQCKSNRFQPRPNAVAVTSAQRCVFGWNSAGRTADKLESIPYPQGPNRRHDDGTKATIEAATKSDVRMFDKIVPVTVHREKHSEVRD